ncbi:MAG: IclR family transcriptional regulator [Sphingomonadales bacterium]|nr:IclR family transcriptional regulator [Sphingomonadales bacterium]MBU3990932.1 IclR family transcriptional regulator [Alphaproteobacteria bacterium]
MPKSLSHSPSDDAPGTSAAAPETDGKLGVQSIEIGMRLVAALAKHAFDNPAPMLKTLAASAGMPPAKAHRYMVSLIRSQLVERDENTGRYRLGPMARVLGVRAIQSLDVVRLVIPRLPEICDALGFSVALAIWTQEGPTVIAVEDPRRPITYGTRVGEVMPLLASATGRVFGAWLPRERVNPLLERPWHVGSTNEAGPPLSREAIDRIFSEVRTNGIGISQGSLTPTVNGLSAPIFDYRGALVAALSTLGPATDLDPAPDGPIACKLRRQVAALSAELGYREP